MSKQKGCTGSNNYESMFTGTDTEKLFNFFFGEELNKRNNDNNIDMSDCDSCDMKSKCVLYLSNQKEMEQQVKMNDHEEEFISSKISDSEKINELASMIMKLQHDINNIQSIINNINKKVSNKNADNEMPVTSCLDEVKIFEDGVTDKVDYIIDKIYKKLKKKLTNQNYEYMFDTSTIILDTIRNESKINNSSIYQNQLMIGSIVSELKSISEHIDLLNTYMNEQKENEIITTEKINGIISSIDKLSEDKDDTSSKSNTKTQRVSTSGKSEKK